MRDIEVFGLKISVYDAGVSDKTKKAFEKGISLSAGGNYMRLSALQFVAMCKVLDDPEVVKELRIRVKEEKDKLAGVQI